MNESHTDIPIFDVNNSTDTTKMESTLDEIKRQGESQYFRDSNGNMVRQYKNLKTVYV